MTLEEALRASDERQTGHDLLGDAVDVLAAEVRRLRARVTELEAQIQRDDDSGWERSER